MFFWQIFATMNNYFKASLQTRYKQAPLELSDNVLNPKRLKNKNTRRTFSSSSPFLEGSMCLEASIAFSLFLIFFVNIFSIIFLYVTYIGEMEQLHQRGKRIAAYAYTADGVFDKNEDVIRLKSTKTVNSVFPLLKIPQCKMMVKCVVKPWTGYDAGGGDNRTKEEEMVYMTEYGQVYHRSRGCTHLSPSLDIMAYSSLADRTNLTGEGYQACSYCFAGYGQGEESFTLAVYITNWGNRYHRFLQCRGLKRTIRCIPLSSVQGTPACLKCG